MIKKRTFWLLSFIFILGIALRIYGLGKKSFWCDEFLAISLGRLSLSEMVRWIRFNDAHPPLFYLLSHFLLKVGNSETILRLLPLLFGIGSLILFYILLKRLMDDKDLILPLSIFALSPAAILWSQILKSYTILTFFTLLSVYCFFSLWKKEKFIYWICWLFSTLFCLYLHNYGFIILLIENLTVVFSKKGFPKKKWFGFQCLLIFLYLPWLAGPLFSQMEFVQHIVPSVTSPLLRLSRIFFYFTLGETIHPFSFKFTLLPLFLVFFLFISGFYHLIKKGSREKKVFFSSCLVILISLIFIVRYTIPQNLIHLQPFFILIIAEGIKKIRLIKMKIGLSIFLPLLLLPSLVYYYQGNSLQYHDVSKLAPYRQIANMIEKEGKKGEAIIFTESRDRRFKVSLSPWDWYYWDGLPLLEINSETTSDLNERLLEIFNNYSGSWLLLNYNQREDWNEKIKDFFAKSDKLVKIKQKKFLKNDRFIERLRRGKSEYYYFLEIYHYQRRENIG